MKKTIMLSLLSGLLVIGGAVGGYELWADKSASRAFAVQTGEAKTDDKGAYQEYVLEAKATRWELKQGVTVPAWTYGDTVPGTQIRAKQGQRVKVVLKNTLDVPVSIHWHGYPVPNSMDGIPGVTQNAVQPGESFTYEFTADVPGTYWYHSHQESAVQVDRGLYGSLIVEADEEQGRYARDYTLVLDEWAPETLKDGAGGGMDHSQHGGGSSSSQTMDHSQHGGSSNSQTTDHSQHTAASTQTAGVPDEHDVAMKKMYNLFTVNGKSGDSIQPLEMKTGELVKLRLINAGLQTHLLNLQGQPFRITHVDGQPYEDGELVTDKLLSIAPGERYDVELTATGENWSIVDHNDSPAASDLVIPVQTDGSTEKVVAAIQKDLPVIDMITYGTRQYKKEPYQYDMEKTLVLNNEVQQGETKYTINGKTYPDTENLMVKKGQRVKLTLINKGTSDHPMHLHGHFFEVIAKDGKPNSTSKLLKDTLNVRPGQRYDITFVADNDGNWMIHCHELHHAEAGMMTHLLYDGYKPTFTPDPNAGNKHE